MTYAPNETRYIGDGVYAKFDGYHIVLSTQQGDQISLEPEVMRDLKKFEKDIHDFYAPKVSE